jgi:hypothetical protein
MADAEDHAMDTIESLSIFVEQEHVEERELSTFISAVTEMFGAEQGRLSERDWLDESDLMDSPPLCTSRGWRAVTIAASARLATRLNAMLDHGAPRPGD